MGVHVNLSPRKFFSLPEKNMHEIEMQCYFILSIKINRCEDQHFLKTFEIRFKIFIFNLHELTLPVLVLLSG